MNAQNIQAHPGSAPGEPVDAGTRLPRPKFVPALFAVLLLVLTTWHAGAHFDPVFIVISK